MPQNLKGIFPPLTTPFEENAVSPDRLKDNITKYNDFDFSGYVILGSTGESIYLSDEESERLVRTARKTASAEKKIIAGTARESTKLTMEFTNRMASAGADAALVRSPGYFKARLSAEALKAHYLRIADSSSIPIIIYNIPVHTGYALPSPLVIELSKHPNIAGIKDSSGDLTFIGELLPKVAGHFDILIGAAGILLPGLIMGISGAVITLASVAPEPSLKLYNLFLEQKWDEARALQLDLIPLNKAIVKTFGVAAAKYALNLRGFYGGPCRSPLPPLKKEEKEAVEKLLKNLDLSTLIHKKG